MKMSMLNKVLQCSGINKKNYIKIIHMLNAEVESNRFSKGFFGGFQNNLMTSPSAFYLGQLV